MKIHRLLLAPLAGALLAALLPGAHTARASSHMDAPLITLDPAANTADVYAFVSSAAGTKYLTVALAVYPFEEPGIGPNKYNFDDRVLYEINVAAGAANIDKGRATHRYRFTFKTGYKSTQTIAQSYLGLVQANGDAMQNLTQTYSVTKLDTRNRKTVLFRDNVVPPNNQGLVTQYYNQGDDGNAPAREGVADPAALDRYTSAGIYTSTRGYCVFAGQRDDGFYADIQSIFDLDFSFTGPKKPFDSQGGFNLHTIVMRIPLTELGGDQQSVGVWASTYRNRVSVLRATPELSKGWVQVGRQGNPLFCEALVSIVDKDLYNRSTPATDARLFRKYALAPELATLLGAPANLRTNRTDLAGIFIPDVIRVDLSTAAARLAGGTAVGAAADDAGFHRLGIFGGDTLTSAIQPGFGSGTLPGGWPNGRRFGDDVLDIAVIAILSDLRTTPPTIFGSATTNIDKVRANDRGYHKIFPYAPTPHNGRNHSHP